MNNISPKKNNIVLIIGNGFDLDLGRRTSYEDFWESDFCPKEYPSPLIKHLNERWHNKFNSVKWFDLENELLYFYKYKVVPGRYDIIDFSDVRFLRNQIDSDWNITNSSQETKTVQKLIKLKIISIDNNGRLIPNTYANDAASMSVVDRDKKALTLIKQGLCNFLKQLDDIKINSHSTALSTLCAINEARNDNNEVQVYTFNYTDLPYDYEDELMPQYIHGRCKDGNIIIGTKDAQELDSNYDFLQKSFDPDFKTPPIVSDLLNADDIIIFGHSLGMNDSQYFKPFFSQQSNPQNPKRKRITIFTKDENSKIEIKRSLQQMTNYNLSLLNSINHLEIITTATIKSNINPFKTFIERYVSDKNLVRSLLNFSNQS